VSDRFSARKPAVQSRARQTIDAILEASARIVYRDGMANLTTNRIAEIAGVSIGSLYQYFPGKDAVLHALVQREFNKTVDDNVRHIESIDTTTHTLEQAVASIVDQVFEGQSKRRPLYRQILMSVLSLKHLRFTLANDERVLTAVRRKMAAYPEVDAAALNTATFVALYILKGVQIGVVFADQPADTSLRAATCRAVLAAVRENKSGTC
jgi:AcrR family transcriptional regulator